MEYQPKYSLSFVYPNQFGYHTDSYKYCQYLKKDFKINYFCIDQGLSKIIEEGITIHYIQNHSNKFKRLYTFIKTIIGFTKKEKIDLLFTIQFKFSFLIGLFSKAKINLIDFRTGDLSDNKTLRILKNRVIWFDSLFYDATSVISQGLCELLHLNQNNTFLLPLGADIISSTPTQYKSINLLYVGSLNKRNVHDTIEGVSIFLKNHLIKGFSIHYDIIGFGNSIDENIIRGSIKKFDLEKVVTFLGRVKHSDLKPYFEKCNVGIAYIPIVPYYEHQPTTKLFEYALSGKYTIATSTFENRKVITKENGILIKDTPAEFARALEYIYLNKVHFNESSIRNSLLNFTWEKISNDILLPHLINLIERNESPRPL